MTEGKDWFFFKKLFYFMVIVVLAVGVGNGYMVWLKYYTSIHPKVVQAVAADYVEELPLEGILLWDEEIIGAPREGKVVYVSRFPRRVAKGETIATVDGHSVKTDKPGYFIAALDGEEGQWSYTRLWYEISLFPELKSAVFLPDGAVLPKGAPLGKLVPQPKDLRCIAYLDKTLEDDIMQGFINIKVDSAGKSQKTAVRTAKRVGQKYKVYLTLPFFPPELLMSRAFSCSVIAEIRNGVSVPASSVLFMEGRQGVFMVKGGVVHFSEVEGFHMGDKDFFIVKGLTAGDIVLLQTDKNRPGDVIISW